MTQRSLLIGAVIVLILGVIAVVFVSRSGYFETADQTSLPGNGTTTGQNVSSTNQYVQHPGSVSGTVVDVAASARVITLRLVGKEITLAITNDTDFLDAAGKATNFSFIRKGFELKADGIYTRDDSMLANMVRVTKEPSILLYSPQPNEEIGLPVVIRGEARVFENQFAYRIKNKDGSVLVEGSAYANSPDVGLYGPYEVSANYPKPKTNEGFVEVFEYSAKDGSEVGKVTVPVRFKDAEAMTIKVFYPNRIKDLEMLDCSNVYAVERRIARTDAPARRAVEELLEGPTGTEYDLGFFTSINSGVRINRLVIENGVAKVDFDQSIENNAGGSCKVASIRSEITKTLMQFSTVKSVIISVEGRVEDILQP